MSRELRGIPRSSSSATPRLVTNKKPQIRSASATRRASGSHRRSTSYDPASQSTQHRGSQQRTIEPQVRHSPAMSASAQRQRRQVDVSSESESRTSSTPSPPSGRRAASESGRSRQKPHRGSHSVVSKSTRSETGSSLVLQNSDKFKSVKKTIDGT